MKKMLVMPIEKDKNNKLNGRRRCSHCNNWLPLTEFEKYGGERGKKKGVQSYRSYCRNCRKDLSLIRDLKVKLHLLWGLNHKCPCHNQDLIYILPAVSFHHPTEKKTYTWSKGREEKKTSDFILKKLKDDFVIAVCENCHRIYTATIFQQYKDLILLERLFHYNATEISKLIEKEIKNVKSGHKSHIRRDIKRFIRKRYVFEKLFKGECICCGKITVFSNLPALTIHHRDRTKKESYWKDIADLDCEEIIKIIIKENVIGVCANCHRIIHSVFYKYIKDIFEDQYIEATIDKIKNIAIRNFKTKKEKVKKFKVNIDNIEFKSPLQTYTFSLDDAWKLRLLQIYYVIKKLGLPNFRRDDFKQFTHIKLRSVTEWLPRLLEMGCIRIEEPITSQYHYYQLMNKGIKTIKKIERRHKKESEKEQKKIDLYGIH